MVARELTGRWTAAVLLAANVAFALYALVEQLGYAGVLFVYWAETVIIAIINVPKLLIVGLFVRPIDTLQQLQQTANRFAAVALAVFVYVIGMSIVCMLLFAAIVALPATLGWVDRDAGFAVGDGESSSTTAYQVSIGILALSHLVSFGVNFLWRREFRGGSLWKLVAQPVLRILGIVAVIGVSLMIAFAQPWVSRTQTFAVLIIAAKIAVDVHAHLHERRRFEESNHGQS